MKDFKEINDFVSKYNRAKRIIQFLAYTFIFFGCIIFLIDIFIILDRIFLFSYLFRFYARGIFLLSTLLVYMLIIRTVFIKQSIFRIAEEIDNKLRLSGKFISAIELQDNYIYSKFLIERLGKEMFEKIKGYNPLKLIGPFNNYPYIFFLVSIFFSVLLFFVLGKDGELSLKRLVFPGISLYTNAMEIKAEFPNFILEGQDLPVRIYFRNSNFLKKAEIIYSYNNESSLSSRLDISEKKDLSTHNAYKETQYTFLSLNVPLKFFIRVIENKLGEKRITDSDIYNVVPSPYPYIRSLKLKLLYPKYTGLKPEIFDNSGNISAPIGTKAYINGEANSLIKHAYIMFDRKQKLAMRVSGKKFKFNFRVMKSSIYTLNIVDYHNIENKPVEYSISALKDSKPEIFFELPGADIKISDDMKELMRINARDDYGIKSVKLYYRIFTKFSITSTNIIEFKTEYLPNVVVQFNWDLEQYSLLPGDVVYYRAKATDGYPYDNHSVFTPLYRIIFPSLSEMYKELDVEENNIEKKLQELRAKQENIKRSIDKLQQRIVGENRISDTTRMEMKKLIKQENQIRAEAEKIKDQLSSSMERIEKNNLYSNEILSKLQKMQKLFKEITSKDILDTIKKLQRAISRLNKNRTPKDLKITSEMQKKLLEKLDNTIKMYERIKKEQKFEKLVRMAKEAEKIQREINKNIYNENGKIKSLSNSEEKVSQITDEIKKELHNLMDSIKQLELKEKIAEGIKFIEDKKIDAMAKRITNALSEERIGEAEKQDASKLLKSLIKLKEDISTMKRMNFSKELNRNIEILKNTITSLLYLNKKEKALNLELSEILTVPRDDITLKKVGKLGEKILFFQEYYFREINKFLKDITGRGIIDYSFAENLRKIAGYHTDVSAGLERYTLRSAKYYSDSIVKKLNIVILKLLEIVDKLDSEGSMAGMKSMYDRLKDLSKQQQGINSESERISSMSNMSRTMQEYLNQLAMEQAMIEQAMQKIISERPGGYISNQLKSIMDDVQQSKKDLIKAHITSDTLKRQKKILNKLLDSQRSLKIRDTEKKRISESAKDYEAFSPEELSSRLLDIKKRLLDIKKNFTFPKQYKDLVDKYFRALRGYGSRYKIESIDKEKKNGKELIR